MILSQNFLLRLSLIIARKLFSIRDFFQVIKVVEIKKFLFCYEVIWTELYNDLGLLKCHNSYTYNSSKSHDTQDVIFSHEFEALFLC